MIFRRTSCRGAPCTIRATVPMLLGTVLFRALIIVLMNLIIDVSYGFLGLSIRACATSRGAIVHDGHLPSEGKGQGRIDA